jgi:hypothetical protein
MADVPPEVVKQLKEKFTDRSLHLVEKFDPEDPSTSYAFVMTGPNRDELDKFEQEMLATKKVSDPHENKIAIRTVATTAALAQIRWPDREEVKRIFNLHPEMVFSFANDIRRFAGDSFETRTKKL